MVLRIRRDDGPDILTFTEAGGLARSGLNAAGIAHHRELRWSATATTAGPACRWRFIRRKVLESEHLALADARGRTSTPKLGSNNMAVSHCGGVAIDFECAPDETFWVAPERGLYVHANHWIAGSARAKLKDTGIAEHARRLYRDKRVREHADAAERRQAHARGLQARRFFDDFASPWSVCRPPRPNMRGNIVRRRRR